MHAIALCLWGTDTLGRPFDRGFLSAPKASVSFDRYGRSLAARGEHVRHLLVDGQPQLGGTEAQFAAELAPEYRDGEAARLVMFPLGWVPLLEGAGGGRPLRTALDRMLPGPTAADLLADLPRVAPREEKTAAALVTTLRKDATTARGRAQGLRSAVPTTPPPAGPTEEQVAAARATLDATAAAREDLAAWLAEDAAHRAALAAVADWQRRRSAIVEPSVPRALVTPELLEAEQAERAANDVVARAVEAARVAGNIHAAAVRAAEQWDARAAGRSEPIEPRPSDEQVGNAARAVDAYQKHPPVGAKPAQPRGYRPPVEDVPLPHAPPRPARERGYRPEPAGACPGVTGCLAAARAEADADRVAAEVAEEWRRYDDAVARVEADVFDRRNRAELAADEAAALWARLWSEYDAAVAAVPPDPVEARATLRLWEAWRAWDLLGERPVVPPAPEPVQAIYNFEAQEALDTARAVATAWAHHDTRVEALGPCPAEPAPLRERPVAPSTAEAQAALDAARTAAQRLADYTAARASAEAKAADAEQEATDCETRLASAESWLVAVRSAPARALAGKLALLGSGALQVLDVDGKTEATINGRPWYLASHGERIAADADFRLRLRAAAGLDALLVFVDDVTSVGGLPLPDAPGVVLLQTTDGAFEVAS
jgi:hypothetical protein